jgi:LacI family transcriptional regulator, galactose operon repressor
MQEQEVTLMDIARELNISESTASRAMKNHPGISKRMVERVQALAKERGYRANNFASSLARRQKTKTIGVIVHKLNSYFITSALSTIESLTSRAGYDLIIAQSSENDKNEINNAHNLFQKRVDGLIATLVYTTENLDHFEPFIKKGIPVVFFDRVDKNSKGTKVIIDNKKGGYDATEHLIEQGCKRIVIVTAGIDGVVPEDRITGTAQRYAGYREALKAHKIRYKAEHLIVMDFNHEDDGIRAAAQILAMDPLPDGLFISNDFHAITCMKELRKAGIRIPEDIAVVGFNNDFMSKITEPELTTIDNPAMEMGEIVAKHLLQQLNGNIPVATNNKILLESKLIVRASSLRIKS